MEPPPLLPTSIGRIPKTVFQRSPGGCHKPDTAAVFATAEEDGGDCVSSLKKRGLTEIAQF